MLTWTLTTFQSLFKAGRHGWRLAANSGRPGAAARWRRGTLGTSRSSGQRQPRLQRSVVDLVSRADRAVGARRRGLLVTATSGQSISWRRVDNTMWHCHRLTSQTSHFTYKSAQKTTLARPTVSFRQYVRLSALS